MDIEAAVRARVAARAVRVPPAPTACVQLSSLLGRDDWAMAELERIVRADQAVTAALLRVANSAALRGREAVTTIPSAVARLGARGVMKLAWASTASSALTTAGPLLGLRQRAWREALVAAHVAQWLAQPAQGQPALSPLDPETSFVVGMLHDIGRLVAASALEDLLVAHPEADTRSDEGWWSLIEALHVAAGSALVEAWQLPHPLAAAVAFHHDVGAWDWLGVVNEVVAQVEGQPHVTPAALGNIATLDTATAQRLAGRLPELVDAIRLIDPTLPSAGEDTSPFEVDALSVSTGEGVVKGSLVKADDAGLVVSLTAPLSTRVLVYVRIGAQRFHARIEPSGSTHFRLRPWALDEAQAQRWGQWRAALTASPA
ncbi:MAG: HDOD domain-containing protein [Myxococcus sp.]|nr:HDOD domain-containing protein [Myxococcus sp.]